MRLCGVMAQPMEPRLRALADAGVQPATVTAACQEARRAKPLPASISPAYVFAIVERWLTEPAGAPAGVVAYDSESVAASALRLLEERDRLQAQEPDHATH